jgi:hypothetical protein
MTVKLLLINKVLLFPFYSFTFYVSNADPSAPRLPMEGWSLFNQYGTYDVPYSQSQGPTSDVDMENENAIDIVSSSTTVGGASDSDGVDLFGSIIDAAVEVGASVIPGGKLAVRAANAIGDSILGKRKRGRYNGPRIPETPVERMGQDNDGSNGGDGGPPPPGPGGNTAATGGSSGRALCCCPCDPRTLKYLDGAIDPVSMSILTFGTSPSDCRIFWTTPTLLNGMFQGSDYGQRVGRKVNLRWLRLKLQFVDQDHGIVSTNHWGNMLRIMIFYDRQANGVAITPATLVGDQTLMCSLLNLNNRHRCVTFLDKTLPLVTDTNIYSAASNVMEFAINLRMLPTIYSGSGGTIAAINTGALFIMVGTNRIANSAGTITNNVTYTCQYRLCYVDQ